MTLSALKTNIFSFLFQLFDRETRREKVIEGKNREQRLKIKTLKTCSEFDFVDVSTKINESTKWVNSKEYTDYLNNIIISQCEQEYINLINTVSGERIHILSLCQLTFYLISS